MGRAGRTSLICLLAVVCGGLGAAAVSAAESSGKKVHLFILSGQSNMVGLNPDESFTPAVTKALSGGDVVVVRDAQGGEPISRWYKKAKPVKGQAENRIGDLYDRLMAKVSKAIGPATPNTITFIWMQGERDAREAGGEPYEVNMKGLIAQLREDLKRQDVNVVIGRISDFDNANKSYPRWTAIRADQVKVAEADPRAAWIDTDDLNGPANGLHYTREGYKALGERFASSALDLIRKAPPAGAKPE
jgi:hypothetical protein